MEGRAENPVRGSLGDGAELPARPPRLRPQPARSEVAGRCAGRRSVRGQFRRGRREQYPARRSRLGSVLVGCARRAAVAGPAPCQYRIDVRIRFARRLLAAVADVHRTQDAGDRVRRRDGLAAKPRCGRRHEGGRLGYRQPQPEMDRAQGHVGGRGARGDRGSDPRPHRGHRRAAAGLVHRAFLDQSHVDLSGARLRRHRPEPHRRLRHLAAVRDAGAGPGGLRGDAGTQGAGPNQPADRTAAGRTRHHRAATVRRAPRRGSRRVRPVAARSRDRAAGQARRGAAL